ncbi:hypothetical protein CVIRNUC_007470 [Coccomyxa viridis]|uniref:Phosphoribulokinase/uridine kinase domain-containing protein n=1 Tax=Coccomyxa viridis TaxID=1274662 RepID=A0AAV1IC07_9CHLO|nr:hypothetical protein CVIRNUC_007470 [Coccomyxa viridis]
MTCLHQRTICDTSAPARCNAARTTTTHTYLSRQVHLRRRHDNASSRMVCRVQLRKSQSLPVPRCMEDMYETLAIRLCDVAETQTPPRKHLVGIAGMPGSGKTTAARHISDSMNNLWRQRHASDEDCTGTLPMDGFHLTRRQLNVLPNPEEAYARRGAPWTFNAGAFLQALLQLRQDGEGLFPSFDHAVGDPKEAEIHIEPHHRVVLIEGNYLLLDEEPWRGIKDIVNESWYVDSDVEEAMERVYSRQIGNGVPPEVARKRIDTNDRLNALQISATKERATLVIPALPLCTEG